MTPTKNAGAALMVKNWHVILTITSWLVVCAMAFAALRSQTAENERRIHDLEQRTSITIQQYQDGQRAIDQRLDRIERKIDESERKK